MRHPQTMLDVSFMSKVVALPLPPFSTYRGVPTNTLGNAQIILSRDRAWQGVLAWDEWAGRVRAMKPPPRHALDGAGQDPAEKEFWGDHLTDRAIVWCEKMHNIAFSHDIMSRAVHQIARGTVFHPIKSYLESLVWDKKRRLKNWLTKYARVTASDYVSAVGTMWMISAVARVYDPGCQVDYVLVLEGPTRGGKSSVLRALCNDPEWFLETGVELGTKDAYQMIRAKWIVELAELDSLSRSESSRVKAFITCRKDTYRKSYGREVIDAPRGCVFAGTTNDGEYLKDETGGARWWPVYVNATQNNRLDVDALVAIRDQLWAEAVARYKRGEKWHPEDSTLIESMCEEQETRRQRDPWEDQIEPLIRGREEKGVSVWQILMALGLEPARVTKADSMRVARCLIGLGWEIDRVSKSKTGKRVKIYKKVCSATLGGTLPSS